MLFVPKPHVHNTTARCHSHRTLNVVRDFFIDINTPQGINQFVIDW